jgi:hypothetical protein
MNMQTTPSRVCGAMLVMAIIFFTAEANAACKDAVVWQKIRSCMSSAEVQKLYPQVVFDKVTSSPNGYPLTTYYPRVDERSIATFANGKFFFLPNIEVAKIEGVEFVTHVYLMVIAKGMSKQEIASGSLDYLRKEYGAPTRSFISKLGKGTVTAWRQENRWICHVRDSDDKVKVVYVPEFEFRERDGYINYCWW